MTEEKIEEKKENELVGERYAGVGSFVLEIIKIVILAFVIIVPIRVFLFQPFFVQGASMEPNFENGEYLIINELGYKRTSLDISNANLFTVKPWKEVARQEPVVFRYPLDPSKFFIKRVIGLPGEKIEIKNSQITIYNDSHPDGFVLDESAYLASSVKTSSETTISLKSDEYFVMGDNRPYSSDSRSWGPVPERDIIGKVAVRAWPLNRMSSF
ncbi:MAG: signal peptidase I [Parcubacteria group bacterium]|jgi:signal peptidase I